MKSQGVSDQELGFLIAIGFISGTVASAFAGIFTDSLGRKKTTLIFDLLGWPASILLLIAADRFLLFALATILGSAVRIAGVSWHLLLVEDAMPEERVAAYNLININIINISSGAVTPLAGMLVARAGMVAGERMLMTFAAISMTAMMILRHRAVRETRIGEEILRERHEGGAALVSFFAIPKACLGWAVVPVILFASGYGLFRPFLDSILAEATEGRDRAGLYGLQNLAISVLSALLGSISGFLYHLHPGTLYLLSLSLLLGCLGLLGGCRGINLHKGYENRAGNDVPPFGG